MKRTVAFLVSMLIALTMIAGYTAASASEALDTSWIFEDDPASIKGEVNWYMPFKLEAGMGDLIAEFNETYPNVTVNLTVYNNNTDGNLSVNTAIMAGQVDVLQSFGLANTYKRWENGLFLDITDRVEAEGIDLQANWNSDKYKYKDRIYTLPSGGQSFHVAINMNAWNEAGLGELPKEWTWDEYYAAMRAMTKGPDQPGGSSYHTQIYCLYPYLQITGGDLYYKADGSAAFDDPIFTKALENEVNAEAEGIIYPLQKFRSENLQAHIIFLNGTVPSYIGMTTLRYIRDTANYPLDWITGFAPYPVMEKGQTNYMSGVVPFSHAGVCTGTQNEEAAWAFCKFLATYGSKYLCFAGHWPTWKGTDTSDTVTMLFGDEENAKKIVDLESFKRVVGKTDNPSFAESFVTAYSEITTILNTDTINALEGRMTPAEAMADADTEAQKAIDLELGK